MHGAEIGRHADETFTGAHDEVAPIGQQPMKLIENFRLDFGGEIDDHVATENNVKRTDIRESLRQVEPGEPDHIPNVVSDMPLVPLD